MTSERRDAIGGVDCHAEHHEAAALDAQGRLLATARFATTMEGYRRLLEWMNSYGCVQKIGVEGSGSYRAGLTRLLRAAGVNVVEVNRPHAHTRARRGKNDAIDAEAAARNVLAGECTAVPKDTTGIVEAIRQLHLARASAVQARTAALNQLDTLVVSAPAARLPSVDCQIVAGQSQPVPALAPRPEASGRTRRGRPHGTS